jgi:NAD(P)-dependent dehydrogenase (short-subunit alcohol dehydrogenase family)
VTVGARLPRRARAASADAGIVDQDVEPVRPLLDSLGKTAHLAKGGEIRRQEFRRAVACLDLNVASAGQQPIDFADVMLTRGYSGTPAYCQSKLAQIMFTFDLAGELDGTGVTVNALHPATYMDTTMVRRAGITSWSSVEEGAEAILKLATSPALDGRSGLYFDGLREARADRQVL